MDDVFTKFLEAIMLDAKENPKKYTGKTFFDGLAAAQGIYENSGYYDINDVERMTDDELLDEAESCI